MLKSWGVDKQMKDPIQHFLRNKSEQTNERCNKHKKQT